MCGVCVCEVLVYVVWWVNVHVVWYDESVCVVWRGVSGNVVVVVKGADVGHTLWL